MKRELFTTTTFERDLRRVKRQGKDLAKLEAIANLLQADSELPARYRAHPLRGGWKGHWDGHVEPDWLLLCKLTAGRVILVRTGSHAELFR